MKKTFRKISLLVILAIVVGMFANVTYAQAASVWSFICGSGKKIEVNDTITLQKNEYQDLNIYKSGKEIKTNDSTYKITWSSSNPDVVWINASTGKLRADRLKKMTTDTGTAKITAKIKNLKTGAVAKRGFTINVIKEKVKGYLDLTSAGWSYNAGLNENMTGGTAGKLYPGAKLEIINEKTNANGVLVCRVYAPDLGRECYVNKKYIKLESEKVAPTATPTVAPTATPTAIPTAIPTAAPTSAPTVNKVYGTLDLTSAGWTSYNAGLNENMTGGTAGKLYPGAKLEILEECTNANGTLVYRVYSLDLGKECYVTAKYVKVDSSVVPPQTESVVTPIVIPEVKTEENKKYGTLDLTGAGWKSYNAGLNINMTGGTAGTLYPGAKLEILEECTNAKGTLVYRAYSFDLGKECYVTAKYVKVDDAVSQPQVTPDTSGEKLEDNLKYVHNDVRYNVVEGFNEAYFFNQMDYPRYIENGKNVGCTATALATAYSIYNNTLLSPGSSKIEWVEEGVVWGPFTQKINYYSTDLLKVYDLLAQNIPVIIRLKGGMGHSVTVVGIKEGVNRESVSTQNLLVIDPNGGKVHTLAQALTNYTGLNSSWELIIPVKK